MRVTVWNENVHERRDESVQRVYPEGIHEVVADGIRELAPDAVVSTATLDQPGQGLPDDVLQSTDVLVWWSHIANDQLDDEVADRVIARVERGMGLVLLHSALYSKVSLELLGTSCALDRWAPDNEQRVWTVKAGHPVTAGVPNPIVIPADELYAEPCDLPEPDELVFISSYSGGAVFRSGCCFRRGAGRIFYFSPGDQQYPVYRQAEVRRVIANAVGWAAPHILLTTASEERL
ncbi:trehalose utilization protein [Kribbella antiqua]|uniref:Trehalose utilization protein n=1 Tax=Kribbella antiqua TaxID=2512217 RepID=A0A4R2J0S7_9ACTN|nr:ThuA domain-containing protein [Kribbella antiqua]TCO50396.1 trehalose utilization protein [Kribbella antiqua]